MKVLGICCGRKNGNTEILMKEAFRVIEKTCGAQCDFIRLQEARILSCTGCESCVVNHMKGNMDFRCVHKPDSDHLYYIEQLMREADAIIVSAPSYNLLPPGIMLSFLNRLHGTGDYSKVVQQNNKIGATFTLGGSDRTNFTLTIANVVTKELVGSYNAIVDQCNFNHLPAAGAVILEEDIIARIQTLGRHVADALLAQARGEAPSYRGDEALCPDCRSSLLEKHADGWYCPHCMNQATLEMVDGEVQVTFAPETRATNRWTHHGVEVHHAGIGAAHAKAAAGKTVIAEKRREYAAYKDAIKLPEITDK